SGEHASLRGPRSAARPRAAAAARPALGLWTRAQRHERALRRDGIVHGCAGTGVCARHVAHVLRRAGVERRQAMSMLGRRRTGAAFVALGMLAGCDSARTAIDDVMLVAAGA